jgi:hypothetical protein
MPFQLGLVVFRNPNVAFHFGLVAFRNPNRAFHFGLVIFRNPNVAFHFGLVAFRNPNRAFHFGLVVFRNRNVAFHFGLVAFRFHNAIKHFLTKPLPFIKTHAICKVCLAINFGKKEKRNEMSICIKQKIRVTLISEAPGLLIVDCKKEEEALLNFAIRRSI